MDLIIFNSKTARRLVATSGRLVLLNSTRTYIKIMNTGSPCDIVHHESTCGPSVVTSCNSSIKKVRCENKWSVQQHNLLEIIFFLIV